MPVLIAFSDQRWDTMCRRPQHLLTRLARRWRVLFVEPPSPGGDAQRAAPHFERASPCDNLVVLQPRTGLPFPGFDDAQLRALQPMLARLLHEEAPDGDVLAWFSTPAAVPLLSALNPRLVVYDCVDPHVAQPMRRREQALLKRAHLVFTSGPGLYEAKRALHGNLHLLPNAVDAAHFAPERITARCHEYLAAEKLQSHILAPRLGYFGVVDRRIDLRLVDTLAERHPEWHVVMVGPVANLAPDELPQRPNIHWLGVQPYRRLPALVAGWDVCLLPFALTEQTLFASPANTLEYLAAEKPVVGTAVPDVVAMYGDVVRIGMDTAGFLSACAAALAETPPQRERRLARTAACVASLSWDDTARTVLRLIEETLERRAARPLIAAVRMPQARSARAAGAASP